MGNLNYLELSAAPFSSTNHPTNQPSDDASVRRNGLALLRLAALLPEVGIKRSEVYQRIKDGLFPPPVAIGHRARAWPLYEIQAVNAALIAGMSKDEIRQLVATLLRQRSVLLNGGV